MKKGILFLICLVFFSIHIKAQQECNEGGEVVVFANYDGGPLTINVDVNIPGLSIGICTYEATTVNIIGPFASNVIAVHYAGYNSYNDHCSSVISATTINAPSGADVEISFAPPANTSDPNGYGSIICAYSCGAGNQGGCNTATQVASYFTDYFGGNLWYYFSQYGCWTGTYNISDLGNCCPAGIEPLPDADFSVSDNIICAGACVSFTDLTDPTPDSWSWSFPGATPVQSVLQNPIGICYAAAGTYTASLSIVQGINADTASQNIVVENCPNEGCTYDVALNFDPTAQTDDGSCTFPECISGCPGDFNLDGIVSVADLLQFIAVYGTTCPQ